MDKIGKIYPSTFPYYEKQTKKMRFKSRPVLIIARPIGVDTEYTVLPVSTLKNRVFYNFEYDVELIPSEYSKLKLRSLSYIRTHKQTVIYSANIDFNRCIGDLKKDYSKCYFDVLRRLEKFNDAVQANSEQY